MEESTTLDEEPTQDKACHSGRFLDSFHSLGMTWSVGGSVMSARVVFGTWHVAMNHRRYIAWYHSTARVVFETWRAANSRPYRRSTSAPIVPTMRDVELRLIHRLRRSPFPEGEGFAWYHSTARVVFGTWRAADCRPYRHAGRLYRSTARVVFGTFPERHTGRSLHTLTDGLK